MPPDESAPHSDFPWKSDFLSVVGSTLGVAEKANSIKGKISNESPVGRALIGAVEGETVTVETPAGQFVYKVLEITAPGKA